MVGSVFAISKRLLCSSVSQLIGALSYRSVFDLHWLCELSIAMHCGPWAEWRTGVCWILYACIYICMYICKCVMRCLLIIRFNRKVLRMHFYITNCNGCHSK